MGRRRKTLGSSHGAEEEELVEAQNQKKKEESDAGNKTAAGGGGVFASCSFADLGLHPTLCQHLQDRMGFQVPTVIQAETIPVVLSGRHLLVNAATGTGKTIVYLAPIIHLLQMHNPRIQRSDGTFALVLVPTRELCMQVYEILQKLLHRFHWIVPGYIMGGESRSKEKARLRKGISILIATPGRLLDHLKNTSSFSYAKLHWIVFDEADRILELGFGKAIEEILNLLGARRNVIREDNAASAPIISRQNLLLSATLNEKVNHLANISLDNPVKIGMNEKTVSSKLASSAVKYVGLVGSDISENSKNSEILPSRSAEDYNLPAQLIQRYVKVPCGSRLVVLLSILRASFARECQKLEGKQKDEFLKCRTFRLHGNMEHDDRRTTFQGFNSEKSALLLCTDVAARGLDFPKVRCIIQYDSPGEATEYVHRVGRTARLGEKGEALLFLLPIEIDYLLALQKHGVSLKEYPVQKILDSFPGYGLKHHNKKLISLEMHPWVLALQKALENFLSKEPEMKKLAKDGFCSWVRAYTAHRGELKIIFMVKKLHLGHVARSFGLREQPSLVGRSFQMQTKKRKRDQKQSGSFKRRRVTKRT